jgi:5-methylcytosine-specific restriction endonuclease McrBC regulatory subunit McrC
MQVLLKGQQIRPTKELKIHASDPVVIKDLKAIGNRILESQGTEYHAWRIDFNKLFEQYVQFIMAKVAALHHSRPYNNQKFSISGAHTNWTLSYLEPDILLKREEKLIIVDAKYKTHMLNRQSGNAEDLQEAFRHDLHQVLAYSSFDPTSQKITMLVFPSTRFNYIKQVISAPLSNVTNHVYLVGIPFGTLPNTDETKALSMADNIIIATEGIKEILDSEFD